jgi:glycosyltransferase involved in cell wall biosynthesis
MPKIALVSPYTLPFYCGNSILVERLRAGLIRRGFMVVVYNAHQSNPEDALAYTPDILHTLNADKSYAWAEQFLLKHTVPWVITFTGTDYHSWCGINAPPVNIKKSMDHASALIVFHEQAAHALRCAAPEIAAKVRVIAQGISCAEGYNDHQAVRSQLGVTREEVVFLMVAGIRPVKNLELAIDAFTEVEKQTANVRLLLVGPVMDRQEADYILDRGSKLKSFRYLGERHPEEVRKIMGACDVLLNTSHHEGMPGAILEAMAEGLPILASAVPGNTALIQNGKNGLLFKPRDRGALIKAIIRLTGDSNLRKSLGHAGRGIAETRYSFTRELDTHYSLYTSLLQR